MRLITWLAVGIKGSHLWCLKSFCLSIFNSKFVFSLPLHDDVLPLISALGEQRNSVSLVFKHDLVEFCRRTKCNQMNALEVGIAQGYTALLLSYLFRTAFAVDVRAESLDSTSRLLKDHERTNVVLIQLDAYADGWWPLRYNTINFVLIDAMHDARFVQQDTLHALSLDTIDWIAFHDYGSSLGVKMTVDHFIAHGYLSCTACGLTLHDSRAEENSHLVRFGPEGQICRALRKWTPFHVSDLLRWQTEAWVVLPLNAKQSGFPVFDSCTWTAGASKSVVNYIACSRISGSETASTSHVNKGISYRSSTTTWHRPVGIEVITWQWEDDEPDWILAFDVELRSALLAPPTSSTRLTEDVYLVTRVATMTGMQHRLSWLFDAGQWFFYSAPLAHFRSANNSSSS